MTTSTTSPEASTEASETTAAPETPAPETPASETSAPAKLPTLEIQVPRAKVYVLSVNPGQVHTRYADSLVGLVNADHANGYGLFAGRLTQVHGANVSKGRNELVRRFLESDGEWALMVDSDMQFPADTILRLLAAATYSKARIVGGLCVMVTDHGPMPTLYAHNTQPGPCATKVMLNYPDNALIQVAATGAACLMVHRSVFERMREAAPADERDFCWFQETVRREHWVSEDIEFCLRAGELGERVVVDTGTQIGHVKRGRVYYPHDIRTGAGSSPRPVVAVIPVKDRLELTKGIVGQLVEQGDATEIVVVDNGSTDGTVEWLAELSKAGRPVTVLSKPDAGIHEMWNAGMLHALGRYGYRAHIAFLNNDLKLGPAFLHVMSRALASQHDLVAVSGNYDGRTYPDPVQPVTDVCAARYDGSGGLAGFAFMVRGDWFTNGYRFPEAMRWWYGDNDLVMTINAAGGKLGIVIDAAVEHTDGGSQTARDWSAPEWAEVLAADKEAFKARWAALREQARMLGPVAKDAAAHDCGRTIGGPRLETVADPKEIVASHQRQWSTEPGMVKIREDLERYERVLEQSRPEVVIECGTWTGRSAQWFAERGVDVITIDIADHRDPRFAHERVTFLEGRSSVDPVIVKKVAGLVAGRRAMVVLDSDHQACHVSDEIDLYAPLVTLGCYLVVEDGAIRYVHPHLKHGPSEAIEAFLDDEDGKGWERDEDIERMHPATQHPAGWLRKVVPADALADAPAEAVAE